MVNEIHKELRDRGFKCIGEFDAYCGRFLLYTKWGASVLVQEYPNGGWELWRPVISKNNISETLDALDNWINDNE